MYSFIDSIEREKLVREGGAPVEAEKIPLLPVTATDAEVLHHARTVLGHRNGAEDSYLRGWRRIGKN